MHIGFFKIRKKENELAESAVFFQSDSASVRTETEQVKSTRPAPLRKKLDEITIFKKALKDDKQNIL